MKKNKISGALATFNEEQNIQDCIDSLKKFTNEIIVVDGVQKLKDGSKVKVAQQQTAGTDSSKRKSS